MVILDTDHYHLSFGAKFTIKENPILLGLDWGFTQTDNEDLFRGFANVDRIRTNPFSCRNNLFTILFTYGFLFRDRGEKR